MRRPFFLLFMINHVGTTLALVGVSRPWWSTGLNHESPHLSQYFDTNTCFSISFASCQGKTLFSPLWKSNQLLRTNVEGELSNDITDETQNICYTQECKEAAAELAGNLNLSADPCTNFYKFTCGGWMKAHPVPKTESHWNLFNLVNERLNFQLKEILESPADLFEPGPVQAAKQLYKTCMTTDDSDSKKSIQPLLHLLDKYGGWPIISKHWHPGNFSWTNMLASLTSELTLTPLIFVYVYIDRKNSNQSILTLDQPDMVIPRSMLVDPKTYKHQLEAYKLWVRETASIVGKAADVLIPQDQLALEAEEIVKFEMELAKLTSPTEMRRNVLRTYNLMTLRQLQTWTDSSVQNEINWLALMKGVTKDMDYTIDWSEHLVVREVDYLFKLMKLMRDTPKKTIANYMHWRVVKAFCRDLSRDLKKLAFKFEQEFTGASMEQPKWKECIYSTNMALRMAVGYGYVQKYFDNSAKQVALEMSENIKSVFSEEIGRLSWMDESTKIAAKFKVETMSQMIGYPGWFANESALELYYTGLEISDSQFQNIVNSRKFKFQQMFGKLRKTINKTEWPISPAVVNAYYNPQVNSLLFPAGILQPPFFKKGRIEALNYGGIGVVIGHEITHGFDDVGRLSDAQGNLVQWWSEKTIETYLKKAECFITQYSEYRVPELDTTLLTKATVNGVTTLGENIADNGGLHSALLAYRKYVAVRGEEPRLPGLEKFTPEQLFFIAFATNWCESSTKKSLLHEILNDPHSPHEFRVLGSLQNSAEFAKAFGCPVRKDKCTMW